MAENWGVLWSGVPIWHNVAWAEAYLRTKWNLNQSSRLAITDMGRKFGAVSILGRGSGSPSNTMWLMVRRSFMSSFILIHLTVWPQYTNVTDRTDRQTGQKDNGPIAWGEPCYKRLPKNIKCTT